MFKRAMVMVLSVALGTSGCASAAGPRYARATSQAAASPTDPALMGDYLQRLPAGSKIKVERTDGRVVTGVPMKVETDAIVVQKNTRVPETPVSVPIRELARVTVDTGHSTALKIWAGVGIGLTCLYVFSALLIASAAVSAR